MAPASWSVARAASPTAPIRPELAITETPIVDLDVGWRDPPMMSRTQCWWWWLNGNVTKEAITQDLEEMRAKGFGGANIIDAGGADQRGHRQVPHGPDFASPEWRELFVHALKEADRLGLELGFNIQSGWNLGGPTVIPAQAAKKLTYSEQCVAGGTLAEVQLPQPPVVGEYYRDVAVVALPIGAGGEAQAQIDISADSAQAEHPATLAIDGNDQTFWVSGGTVPGEGPSTAQPSLVEVTFSTPTAITELVIRPRDEYGPKRGWVQYAEGPHSWHLLTRWSAARAGDTVLKFPRTTARRFRLVIVDAYDPRSPLQPRNAQIAEIEFKDGDRPVAVANVVLAKIDNHRQKAYYDYPGPFTATRADHLLNVQRPVADERVIRSDEVIDLTSHVDATGRLKWQAPEGQWLILRIGYTLSGSRVSTSSQGWDGWAIDYLDPQAFERYWRDVAGPVLAAAQPYLGRSLKFLHTDSWELGPINWTANLPQEFQRLRGYDLQPYLPVLAGYVIDDRTKSNRFLNDFRRTLADLIASGKYAHFRQHAHELGLGIHPESGGPHAAPIDALLCLGLNDIPMGEFWARSETHRVHDYERLFTKQAASAAHVYGKRIVLAESFTSIGPQWEKAPRDLKPVFDRVACEGLNEVMLHTYDCSPDEMGDPGQAYFAGTHINRHITWWNHADAFINYLNRCQFLLQQGLPVSDVLYFYGENVPSFVRLKDDDPARVLPGYDYDVINAEALIERTSVRDGRIVLPEGTSYEVLVLPPHNCYGLETLRHVAGLVDAGATVVGPRPTLPMGLSDDPGYEKKFRELADRLWGCGRPGPVRPELAREALKRRGVGPDFLVAANGDEFPHFDYIHRRTTDADVYFVVNRLDRWQDAECSCRIAGKQPELWDPLSGDSADAEAFWQADGRTIVPLRLPPDGSLFVVFRRGISTSVRGPKDQNVPRPMTVGELEGPWDVAFDAERGGPAEEVLFKKLTSWSDRPEDSVKYYSGPAVYHKTFDLSPGQQQLLDGQRWWLDLGKVKNIASVRLNGRDLGVAWTEPFRLEVSGCLQPTGNQLEIEVTNLWPNRLIGDERLPESERHTATNITKFRADSPLLESGLLGPVRMMSDGEANRR